MKTTRFLSSALALCAALAACHAPTEPAKPAATASAPAAPAPVSPALLSPEKATEKAPDVYKARFATSKGDFVVEVRRDWSPNGADRFYNLVKIGFYDDVAFFRVVSGFMAQLGIHGAPEVMAKWRQAAIPDDPVKASNTRGALTFATAGPNTRTTQFFINFANNSKLDGMGFSSFGKVVQGMEVVESLYNGYGDAPAFGGVGPDQGRMQMEGNAYLKKEFPQLDYVKTARIEK